MCVCMYFLCIQKNGEGPWKAEGLDRTSGRFASSWMTEIRQSKSKHMVTVFNYDG